MTIVVRRGRDNKGLGIVSLVALVGFGLPSRDTEPLRWSGKIRQCFHKGLVADSVSH